MGFGFIKLEKKDETMKKIICLLAGLIALGFVNSAAAINFVEVQSWESPSEIDYRISHGKPLDGDVVVFTRDGKPLLPDLAQRKKQEAANELSFTFDSPEYPWTAQELATLQQLVADFYPVVKKIYGNPAFSITVNIRKNPTITFAGLYYPSNNELVIHDLNTFDPFVHEMIHAFRDDLVISSNAYEEGMTRATEIAAFGELPQYPFADRNYSHGDYVYYELNNQEGISSKNGNFFLGFPSPEMRYQTAGYAWGKLIIEDNAFMAKFNTMYYPLAYTDPSISSNTTILKGLAEKIKHRIESESFNSWYSRQYIFNENPGTGYQTVYRGYPNILYVYERDASGFEHPLEGVTVTYQIYSCDGVNLSNGTGVTSELGWIEIPIWLLYPDYKGKIRIVADIYLNSGISIKRELFASTTLRSGIFGICDECTGEIDIVRVSSDGKNNVRNVAIENGAFSIPELASIPGKFTIKQHGGAERTITKDASDYFVIFGAQPTY